MPLRDRRRVASLHSVFERTFHEHGRAILGWIAGLATLAVVQLALYPTVRDNEAFSKIMTSYPKAFRALFGIADYTSGPGYLRAELFSVMAPLLIVVFAILWGSDLIAGEEERHTIDVLLANPISRRRLLVEKWAALLVGTMLLSASLGVVLAIGAPLVGLRVGASNLWAAVIASALLGLTFGTLALTLGAGTGHRGLARGISTAVAVAAYLLSSLPDLVNWLRPGRPLSPWYHAVGVDPLSSGFEVAHLGVLLAIIAVTGCAAVLLFDRRDLAT